MAKRAELVCFDWGGVILRHCRSWEEACRVGGLEMRAGIMAPELVHLRRLATRAFQAGRIACDEFYDMLTHATGGLYTREECVRLHDAWLLDEYEGMSEVVDEIHARGVVTALLSNTNESHWRRGFPEMGKADYPTAGKLRHAHASHLLGFAKPQEEIYRAFENAVGVRGEGVLFFDDLEENLATARGLGWQTVRVDHTGDTAAQVRGALREFGLIG